MMSIMREDVQGGCYGNYIAEGLGVMEDPLEVTSELRPEE